MSGPSGRAHVTVKIGVNLPWQQRMLAIPKGMIRAAALGLWTAANCYTREHELDGFCPFEPLESYMSDEVVSWLVKVGLIALEEQDGGHGNTSDVTRDNTTTVTRDTRVTGCDTHAVTDDPSHGVIRGIRILRYSEFNETKDQITKRLRGVRLRQKECRARKNVTRDTRVTSRVTTGNGIGYGSDLSEGESERESAASVVPIREPTKTEELRKAVRKTDDGCFGHAVDAWVAGVREATGRPLTLTRGLECTIADAIVAHCPKIDLRESWARQRGTAWARQRLEAGLSLQPLDFPVWEAGGERPSGVWKRAPTVQPDVVEERTWKVGDGT